MRKYIYTIGFGLLSKFLLILTVIYISRHASLEDFGTYELAITSVNLLFPILCVGVIDGIFRFCINNENKGVVFSRLLFVGTLSFILLSPLALYILNRFFTLKTAIIILIVVLINFFIEAIKQLEKSKSNVNFVTGVEFSKSLTFLLLVVTFSEIVNVNFNFINLLYLQGISGFVVLTSFFYVTKVWCYIKINKEALAINRDELSYSLFMMPNSILWWVMNASDKFILSFFSGPASVAVYAVATKFPSLITALNRIFIQIWHVSIISDENDKSDNRNKWLINFVVLNFSFVFLTYTFYFLFDFLFDERFSDASIYLQFLLVGSYYSVLSSLLGGVFMREKLVNIALITTLVSAVINIILNFIFVPIYGIIGCVISTVVSLCILFFARYFYVNKNNLENIKFVSNVVINLTINIIPFFLTQGSFTISLCASLICLSFTVKVYRDNYNGQ